jgi:hypothetical protein
MWHLLRNDHHSVRQVRLLDISYGLIHASIVAHVRLPMRPAGIADFDCQRGRMLR